EIKDAHKRAGAVRDNGSRAHAAPIGGAATRGAEPGACGAYRTGDLPSGGRDGRGGGQREESRLDRDRERGDRRARALQLPCEPASAGKYTLNIRAIGHEL